MGRCASDVTGPVCPRPRRSRPGATAGTTRDRRRLPRHDRRRRRRRAVVALDALLLAPMARADFDLNVLRLGVVAVGTLPFAWPLTLLGQRLFGQRLAALLGVWLLALASGCAPAGPSASSSSTSCRAPTARWSRRAIGPPDQGTGFCTGDPVPATPCWSPADAPGLSACPIRKPARDRRPPGRAPRPGRRGRSVPRCRTAVGCRAGPARPGRGAGARGRRALRRRRGGAA